MLLDQQQLAATLNITTRTIRSWHSEGCPIHSQEVHCTLYHLPDVLEFVVKKRVGNELTYEKIRLTAAMATKTELETKLLQQGVTANQFGEHHLGHVLSGFRREGESNTRTID